MRTICLAYKDFVFGEGLMASYLPFLFCNTINTIFISLHLHPTLFSLINLSTTHPTHNPPPPTQPTTTHPTHHHPPNPPSPPLPTQFHQPPNSTLRESLTNTPPPTHHPPRAIQERHGGTGAWRARLG